MTHSPATPRAPTAAEWNAIQASVENDCPLSIVCGLLDGRVQAAPAADRIEAYATAAFKAGRESVSSERGVPPYGETPRTEAALDELALDQRGAVHYNGGTFIDFARQLEREGAEAWDLYVTALAEIDRLGAVPSATREMSENEERYLWFRKCPTDRQMEILELAGEFPEMLDHHIDKGRCGL